MRNSSATNTLADTKQYVKCTTNTQRPLSPDMMIAHSNPGIQVIRGNKEKVWRETSYYGQSWPSQLLTKGMFLKRYHQVVRCLRDVLGLSDCECEGVLRLLRFGAYYRQVYPKVEQVCLEPGCSPATFRRAMAYLKQRGLIDVVRRILTPRRRQISNLYLLHKLLILIARYLAEHGQQFYQEWLKPYLAMPGSQFWRLYVPAFSDA